jgi:Thermophilic glucose-6-phosphate isomerase and related metalloenzymes
VATCHDSKSLVQNFKYPFSFANKRTYEGGWSREVTVRELPVSKTLAGVNMRLTAGGFRELHWHTAGEWAIMLYGNARITAIDLDGKSFVADVGKNDLWFFPSGIPSLHSRPESRWMRVHACLRRRQFFRVRNGPVERRDRTSAA